MSKKGGLGKGLGAIFGEHPSPVQEPIKEAKDNASAIVHEALVNAQKTEQDAELLKKNVSVYMARVKSLTEAQLKLLNDMEGNYK